MLYCIDCARRATAFEELSATLGSGQWICADCWLSRYSHKYPQNTGTVTVPNRATTPKKLHEPL